MTEINGLKDLRPGDIMFGPIGGLVPGLFPVGVGQAMLGEVFRVGGLSVRHVGIVVEASAYLPPGSTWKGREYAGGVITQPQLVQAMPGGAEIIDMRQNLHWTPRHAYARLPEDWPGQAADAAAIARLMVERGVAYSWASYAALAAWKWGIKTPRLERWIDRRGERVRMDHWSNGVEGRHRGGCLPIEAICSVLVDQAWTLAGKCIMQNTAHQAVTPGALAGQLLRTEDITWGWAE